VHLREEEFFDLADATLSEAQSARLEGHLASCATCRQQLADLRAALTAASAVEVPEPSPLFWDHFSRRVREAVAVQGGPDRTLFPGLPRFPWLFPAAAAAALLLVLVLVPGLWRSTRGPQPASMAAAPPSPSRETLTDVTDPSLTLVADLADGIDWESAREAGLAPRGSAEHAVTHLTDRELRELQRLLQQELAHASD